MRLWTFLKIKTTADKKKYKKLLIIKLHFINKY